MVVSFTQSTLSGNVGIAAPTALQWGPDGKLYVTSRFGKIAVLTIEQTAPGAYSVVSSEIIAAVAEMPNHDDDGSLAGADNDGFASIHKSDPDLLADNERQVTGIVVTGTAENPIIYVSSSDPRVGAGTGGTDKGLDTNSGVISRL